MHWMKLVVLIGSSGLFGLSCANSFQSESTNITKRVERVETLYWAIGDSYSAGPGAGADYDDAKYGGKKCYRNQGAYPPQLYRSNAREVGALTFLSCTGHVAADVVKWQIPDLPWRWFPVAGQHDRVRITLSVGGNDLLFGEYVQACLLRVPWKTCDKTVARINNLIDNTDGKDTLENSLVEVWKRLQYDTRAIISKWYVPPIIHTGYPEFFNAKDPKCNKKRILKVGPLLSEKLREDTNSLVRRANSKIEEHLKNFRNKEPRLRGHTQFVNYNDRWNGHRLCEPFVTASGPGFEDPEVWFLGVRGSDAKQQEETEYDINTCDPESTDIDHAFGCGLAIYAAQNPNEDLDEWYRISQEWIKKAFHPKSSGFEKVRDAIVSTWFGPRPALRVLALGDSITNGYKSSDEAGYRGVLYDYLTKQGVYKVDMIGSVKAGTMSDPDHEGHNGATIAQISRFADLSLGQRPNVVLLHAGTNDLGNDNDATGAVSRLADLIDKIIKKCPDAAILVAAIIPATDRARQGRTNTYNAGVAALVSSRAKAGKKVLLMNMDMVLTTAQLSDGLHPNDEGYAVMGTHWAGGINEAFQKGWIKDPVAGKPPGNHSECPTVPTWLPQGTVASGGGLGSGGNREWKCRQLYCEPGGIYEKYKDCADHCSEGECISFSGNRGPWGCRGCKDAAKTCTCSWLDGKGDEIAFKPTSSGKCSALERKVPGVFLADIDGDGRDDYLHVKEDGEVYMYWNTGKAPDTEGNAGKVQWLPVGVIASGGGAKGYQVRFADLDGDGRAEFIWVKDSGSATVWWNRGFNHEGSTKVVWSPGSGEEIATGIGDGQGVHFADMNGDGLADFIHLSEEGAATLYINQGRRDTGNWGWWGWGKIATGVGSKRENIRFADMNGDGRDDYMVVDEATGGLKVWYNRGTKSGNWGAVSPIVWWNPAPIASGVNYLPNWSTSDMVTFGDLNGDGRDEYIYIGVNDSSIYAFLNGC